MSFEATFVDSFENSFDDSFELNNYIVKIFTSRHTYFSVCVIPVKIRKIWVKYQKDK